MSNRFQSKEIKVNQLMLSPQLTAEYRLMLLGFVYYAKLLSELPEKFLVDYMIAHPPFGVMAKDGQFHVTSNVRTLAVKPHVPPDTKILVIVDLSTHESDLNFVAAQRELLNCMVPAMKGKFYCKALAAFWNIILKVGMEKAPMVPSKTALAKLAGLRRQMLSVKELEMPAPEFMRSKGALK